MEQMDARNNAESKMSDALKILYLLILDIVTIALMTALVVWRVLPSRPWASLGVCVLFLGNVVLARRSFRDRTARHRRRVPVLLWLAASVFTAGALVVIVLWSQTPSLGWAIQTIIAILLAAYIWFLVYRFRRKPE